MTFPWEYNPHNVRLWVIGHEYGPVVTIEILRKYEGGYVCLWLGDGKARDAIEAEIGRCKWGLQEYLWKTMDGIYWAEPFFMRTFEPYNLGGIELRKEWCNHMANEIEREHFGHADQTA